HAGYAVRYRQYVERNMLRLLDRFDDIPIFWSANYDKLEIKYTGHVDRWDQTRIDGDLAKMDCTVFYIVSGKPRAVATINRNRANLRAEIELETELLLKPSPLITIEAEQV